MERHDVNKKGYNAIHCQSAFAFHIFAESQSPTLLLSIMMDQGEKIIMDSFQVFLVSSQVYLEEFTILEALENRWCDALGW